ncbi:MULTISPECIES: bifunctional diguanylate cyclase/phosphodiesterase [Paraburkholderia]|uniref:bifunctional diguanylate cyclase/phosphodiesterase n=1 Tax=Paraburkholderia TaxID=1822464 RepID=UPI0022532A58|nr:MULTISPECIES: EAL domain-containing protein [Paraburkholderia]MCX4159653.1 EAL domain-containing protein [Paraburkholderia aspalathi]MDN7169051.1 EAL domain-containing protein [Paraburkholderia sp. SECH2]MDQ6397538.1 EAL domain-containing protein [Paraburkholderia aspalathi]
MTAVLIGVIWIVAFARIQFEGTEARRATAERSAQLTDSFSTHIDRTIHDADVVLRRLKAEYERSPSTFALETYGRQGVISADTALQVAIVGADGEVIQSTTPGSSGVNLADRPHFKVHETNRKAGLYISQPVLGRISYRWTLQFTRRPNHSDDSFAGVVVVSEDPDYLTDGFYNLDAPGSDGMLAVISDSGYLLSRRAGGERGPANEFSAHSYCQLGRADGGTVDDPVDHVRRFLTCHQLVRYPFAVLVGLSEREVLAGYRRAKKLYLLMGAVASALLVIAAAIVTITTGKTKTQNQTQTDGLTGLPDRYMFVQALRRRMQELGAASKLAVMYIDLNDFKYINGTLQPETGDDLLRRIARRVADVAGQGRLLARIGGDEFVVLLDGDGVGARAVDLAGALIRRFDRPFGTRGNSHTVRLRIGVVVYDDSNDTEFDVLTKANLAMDQARIAGKGAGVSQHFVYSTELSERAKSSVEKLQSLQHAIIKKEFFLDYQPIVGLDGELRGVEALVRWRHPDKGVISPADFIPLAESSGLIVQIGEFVIDQACRDFCQWQKTDPRPLTLSINVSPVQLMNADVVRTVRRCLDDYMIAPNALQVEVTETVMLEGGAVVRERLGALREAGVRIVLDDFGAGYSSLSQLVNLAIDGVKIDRDFMKGIPTRYASTLLLTHLIRLTRELNLSLVIEGVETRDQVEWLSQFGDLAVQGFYFSKPVSPAELPIARCGT